MAWRCNLPGFKLRIFPRSDGRWVLSINGIPCGAYYSPAQAADDAYTQHTGDDAYDSSPFAAPEDLREWDSE